MLYRMQLLAYSPSGSLRSSGDSISLGEFKSIPVQLMLNRIHFLKNDLSSMNLACGLLPHTIERERLVVVILVLDDSSDSINYTEMYMYKQN